MSDELSLRHRIIRLKLHQNLVQSDFRSFKQTMKLANNSIVDDCFANELLQRSMVIIRRFYSGSNSISKLINRRRQLLIFKFIVSNHFHVLEDITLSYSLEYLDYKSFAWFFNFCNKSNMVKKELVVKFLEDQYRSARQMINNVCDFSKKAMLLCDFLETNEDE